MALRRNKLIPGVFPLPHTLITIASSACQMPFLLLPRSSASSYLRFMGQYKIGDAIRQFLNQSRIKGDIQALQIEAVWAEVMGKTIARYTDGIKVINRTLFVTTNVAPLKQELLYQREKIKLRVNEALGEKLIDTVVIQ